MGFRPYSTLRCRLNLTFIASFSGCLYLRHLGKEIGQFCGVSFHLGDDGVDSVDEIIVTGEGRDGDEESRDGGDERLPDSGRKISVGDGIERLDARLDGIKAYGDSRRRSQKT